MNKRIFEWDSDYLETVTREAIKSAKDRYNKYLGDGSPLQTISDIYFMRILDIACSLAKTAGSISPSCRALNGVVAVSILVWAVPEKKISTN